jgi:hypothetical protein
VLSLAFVDESWILYVIESRFFSKSKIRLFIPSKDLIHLLALLFLTCLKCDKLSEGCTGLGRCLFFIGVVFLRFID